MRSEAFTSERIFIFHKTLAKIRNICYNIMCVAFNPIKKPRQGQKIYWKGFFMYSFFAYMSRMKLIRRWSLMKAVTDENIAEHSAETAQLAHALAVIAATVYGKQVNADRVATLALYHESSEVITGDLPTPIKYYNPEIRDAYKSIEGVANAKLLSMLPDELKAEYTPLIEQDTDTYEHKLVKAADKLSAYVKCIEELKSGNREFAKAEVALKGEVEAYFYLDEVKYFCDKFLPSFSKTLDELE